MKEKKTPLRMCIACRVMKDKRELARVVKSKEGEISLDFSGKKNGRGAYICDNAECINKCVKQRLINRTFRCEVDSSVYDSILKEYDLKCKEIK